MNNYLFSDKDDHLEKVKETLGILPSLMQNLPFQVFNKYFVYKFDQEAVYKNWQSTKFQDTLEGIWEHNTKTCVLAPRSHLKTSTALNYILNKIFIRKHPLEVNYYHLNERVASEKFSKIIRIIESNPILAASFCSERAKRWNQKGIELYDGTIIQPISYGQGIRGKHPHMIILDDVIDTSVIYSDLKNRKSIEKFYTDIYPMITKLDSSKKIIIIGTAQRKDDLYHSLPPDFVFQTFHAVISDENKKILCPELFTYDTLMKLKSDISSKYGERFWLKEYMNMPFEAIGLIIRPEWIHLYYEVPQELQIFQGWDLAVGKNLDKGDYTVCVTIGVKDGKIYVLDVFRERLDFGSRLKAIERLAKQWNPSAIGIEDVSFQYDTVQELKNKTYLPIQSVKPIINKIQSFQAELSSYFENGKVFIDPQMEDFRKELLSLPVGQHDDQADALKIAIKVAQNTPETGHFPDEPLPIIQPAFSWNRNNF